MASFISFHFRNQLRNNLFYSSQLNRSSFSSIVYILKRPVLTWTMTKSEQRVSPYSHCYDLQQLKQQRIITRAIRSSSEDRDPRKSDHHQNIYPSRNYFGYLASFGLGASILIGKTKYILVAMKLTKTAPLISMLISSLAYSFIFGWPYAIGMMSLIFLHECGHLAVMQYYKIPFSPMVFLPFMGAVIAMKEQPRNAFEDAMIAFGGPVLGTAAAMTISILGIVLDSQLLLALADFGLIVNLFNLLPIGSMDGGRIGGAVSPYVGVIGLFAGSALIFYSHVMNPLFYIIMITGIYTTFERIFNLDGNPNKDYYKISKKKQLLILCGYVGLVISLLLAMNANNNYRKTPKQIKENSTKNAWDELMLEEQDTSSDASW